MLGLSQPCGSPEEMTPSASSMAIRSQFRSLIRTKCPNPCPTTRIKFTEVEQPWRLEQQKRCTCFGREQGLKAPFKASSGIITAPDHQTPKETQCLAPARWRSGLSLCL